MLSGNPQSARGKDQALESLRKPLNQEANLLLDALVSGSSEAQVQGTRIRDSVFRERPGIVFPRLHPRVGVVGATAPEKPAFFESGYQFSVAHGVSWHCIFGKHRHLLKAVVPDTTARARGCPHRTHCVLRTG